MKSAFNLVEYLALGVEHFLSKVFFCDVVLFDQPYLSLLDSGPKKSAVGCSLANSIDS